MAALLMAAVRNMMLLPAEAAVPALLENSSIAFFFSAGEARISASPLSLVGSKIFTGGTIGGA
ncbi:hypothetical protein GIW40_20430 [Pseudomonas syringae]|nr:hypothetical protein [Pseudomonas syringae]